MLLNLAVRPARISIWDKNETAPMLFHVFAESAGIRSQQKENTSLSEERKERGIISLPFPKMIPHFTFPES